MSGLHSEEVGWRAHWGAPDSNGHPTPNWSDVPIPLPFPFAVGSDTIAQSLRGIRIIKGYDDYRYFCSMIISDIIRKLMAARGIASRSFKKHRHVISMM